MLPPCPAGPHLQLRKVRSRLKGRNITPEPLTSRSDEVCYQQVVCAPRGPVYPMSVDLDGRFRPWLQSLALGLHCLLW
jgi:hypothetical protein